MTENIDLKALLNIAVDAGEAIMRVYNRNEGFEISAKADNSPLTIADKIANDLICEALKKLYPHIPVLSEEGRNIPYEERKNWKLYWCVDPLDGTKEFIKRNGEFTVNIALINNQQPILGIIYVPVQNLLYYATAETGSWKQRPGEDAQPIKAVKKTGDWTAATSRSHADAEEEAILSQYPVSDSVAVGSSLKFCLLAEGKAQIYLRKGPTMEWDTAAGHAISLFSGCIMSTLSGKPMLYNKESLLNEGFLCKIDIM